MAFSKKEMDSMLCAWTGGKLESFSDISESTEVNEDLTQEELDTLYGIGLLGIAEQEEAEAIATEAQAQLPELNPKQIELVLKVKVEDKFEGIL